MPRSITSRLDGRIAASDYLQQLLLKPGAYRQSWEQYVSRERRGTINQLAVAEVIARHLWTSPRGPSDVDISPHQLKDTVSRALTGRLLSRQALTMFIEAFGFSEHEATRLWRLWNGSGAISVMSGTHAVPMMAEQSLAETLGPRQHQTLSFTIMFTSARMDESSMVARCKLSKLLSKASIAFHSCVTRTR